MAINLNIIKRNNKIIDDRLSTLESAYMNLKTRLDEYAKSNKNTGAVSIANAQADVESMLVDTGYYDIARKDNSYAKFIKNSEEMYREAYGRKFDYAPVSVQELQLMQEQHFNKFLRLTANGRDAIAENVFNLRLGGIDLKEARESILELVDTSLARYVNTWVETASTSFANEAGVRLAEDNGITKFQYVGPEDKLIRPFCQKYLDEIKTLEEWDELNDEQGQIPPVSIYRGGYNCRHQLVGVE
jgi:hypothetical protein